MCGIFGYFERIPAGEAGGGLEAMADSIRHRGPDDRGLFVRDCGAVGNNRLSIIDVAGGHQPFVSDDGLIAIVQNGEIYNHVELAAALATEGIQCRTRSDTEVLLRLYEKHGDLGFLPLLNGMFSIAILDLRARTLLLARDRAGVKPLFVHDDGNRLVFASEIKSLLAFGVSPKIDLESLNEFLTFNFVPPPRTMFDGVAHLPPGHAMRVTAEGVQEWEWWSLADSRSETRTETAWGDEMLDILRDAVRLRLRSDVPFGAFLSGGVDSSLVVGLMSEQLPEPVRTFSIGFDDPRFDESPYFREAAGRFRTAHFTEQMEPDALSLWPMTTYYCDQPHGDVSFIPTYCVSRLAAKYVKVVLTGDGGDELFGGYDKYREFFADPEVFRMGDREFRRAYFERISLFGPAAKVALFGPALRQLVGADDGFTRVNSWFDRCAQMDRVNQTLFLDLALLLPGNNLVKPDRMAMSVSLEARTPFLDYRLMDLAFRMPGEMKLRGPETKYLLKKVAAPIVGENIAYRRKQMFTVPIGEWLRGRAGEYAESILLTDRLADRGFFDTEFTRGLIARHRSGAANYTREIRALIAFELWCQEFLDRAPARAPRAVTAAG